MISCHKDTFRRTIEPRGGGKPAENSVSMKEMCQRKRKCCIYFLYTKEHNFKGSLAVAGKKLWPLANQYEHFICMEQCKEGILKSFYDSQTQKS